jgi:Asp-tRNA(Asn)/Glu-tRNA(Gln) amidotransferase A subunit family amidase
MAAFDYQDHDAVGLASLIATKQVSAREVVEAALARLNAVNPRINAVTQVYAERALAEADSGVVRGPLAGVPFLLKDLGAQLAGTVTTYGSSLLPDTPAAADNALVAQFRAAGLIMIGKTNTPEFGLEPVTEPVRFGPTRNPWDLERTAGGSSGGAAAAVAAGITPAAHASDGGGSIRIPASACGLFGLKPTRGRVSFAPADEGWGGFSISNSVSWTVRDSAALLDAICQPQPGDPYWQAPPAAPFATEVGREPGRLRVGYSTAALAAPSLDPECAEAVRQTAALCESLGHGVEEAALPGDYDQVGAAGGTVIAASVAAMLDTVGEQRGKAVGASDVEPVTWAMYERGKGISGSAYVRALQTAHAFGRAMAALFERYDILLMSTLGSPAIPVGHLRGDPRHYADRLFAFMPNTQAFNITGQPAMSVPLATSRSGLPIGMQFTARAGEDGLLFRLASQLEKARPWAARRPSI